MKKTNLSILILTIVLLIGAFYLYKNSNEKEQVIVKTSDYKNTSYIVNGERVTFVNGASEVGVAPGSTSRVITKYFGNEISKDLNGDGKEDVTFLITQETGGTGTFFYVVAALNTEDGYKGSDAVLLGDRIDPQTIESGPGNSIIVNYLDRTLTESMATKPSVSKSIRLILDPETMKFGQVEQNFEGEADIKVMNLDMKTWKWVKAELSDGKIIEPNKKDEFTLTFNKDGSFSAKTDCNSMGGKYVSTKNTITFKDIFSTKMYCEGSQENEFSSLLDKTTQYMFTSKGELVLNLKYDSGSVFFK